MDLQRSISARPGNSPLASRPTRPRRDDDLGNVPRIHGLRPAHCRPRGNAERRGARLGCPGGHDSRHLRFEHPAGEHRHVHGARLLAHGLPAPTLHRRRDLPVFDPRGHGGCRRHLRGLRDPAGASPGIYHLKVRSAAGVDSSNNQWIAVDVPEDSRGCVRRRARVRDAGLPGPDGHRHPDRRHPGERTVRLQLLLLRRDGGKPRERVDERVDTSIPWENPASLDPQIEIVAPDGFIYSNLQAFDNVPGQDLNASIAGAYLPQTGLYLIAAETIRGSGAYRLSFSVDGRLAPAGSRAIALSGGGFTLPLNRTLQRTPHARPARLPDRGGRRGVRGRPNPDDTGAISFTGGAATQTSLQGIAVKSAQITAAGKVRFRASFTNPVLERHVHGSRRLLGEPVPFRRRARVPLYRPAARRPFSVLGIGAEGILISERALTRLEPEPVAARRKYTGPKPAAPLARRSRRPRRPAPAASRRRRKRSLALSRSPWPTRGFRSRSRVAPPTSASSSWPASTRRRSTRPSRSP